MSMIRRINELLIKYIATVSFLYKKLTLSKLENIKTLVKPT